jgi:hypothetical protein
VSQVAEDHERPVEVVPEQGRVTETTLEVEEVIKVRPMEQPSYQPWRVCVLPLGVLKNRVLAACERAWGRGGVGSQSDGAG